MTDVLMSEAIGNLQSGRLDRALEIALEVAEADPDHLQAKALAGVAATMLGRFETALPLFEEVADRRPDDAEARYNVGCVLKELKRFDEAVHSFEAALELQPNYFEALHNCAGALFQARRLDAATALYHRALEVRPEDASAHHDLGMALRLIGDEDGAVDAFRHAVTLRPDQAGMAGSLGAALLRRGDGAEALRVADDLLALRPRSAGLLAVKAAALRQTGNIEAARRLEDHGGLLRMVTPGPPPGFDDLQAFHDAIEAHIRQHPSLMYEPSEKGTRRGFQTRELLAEPKGPFEIFEQLIVSCLRYYFGSPPADPTHPFLKERPDAFHLTAWATILERGGHQIPHIHPLAWLSGVYYVKVPAIVAESDPEHKGWIEFGHPLPEFGEAIQSDITPVFPKEGTMVLFPSYLSHRTVPIDDDAERISIAFDATPRD